MDRPIYLKDIVDGFFLKNNPGEIYEDAVGSLEKILIEKALERTEGNQITAAKMLGLNRNTIRAKIKRLGVKVDAFKR
ncbi:MAG: helix-turn-helix domain-containing protein [Candidatus Omnitrophota bacterium]